MKTLHGYLTRQVLQTLVMTVIVCTSVLLLANGLREILPLLASQKASLLGVGHALALLIPYVLVFSLPLGLLTATLLVFGRLSADQEYTAVRAGGISLVALITPVILLSVALCCLSALVNMEVGPRCRIEFKKLINRFLLTRPDSFITENRFITEYESYVIYVGKRNGDHLENVLVNVKENNELVLSMRAPEGTIVEDKTNNLIILKLRGAQAITRTYDTNTNTSPATNTLAATNSMAGSAAALKTNLVAGTNVPAGMGSGTGTNLLSLTNVIVNSDNPAVPVEFRPKNELRTAFGNFEMSIDLNKAATNFDEPKISEMTMTQLMTKKRELKAMTDVGMSPTERRVFTSVVNVQIHRQVSFSFACLGFTLVGIPLGIRAHRKETLAGIGIALGLVLVYYSFIIIGQSMDTRPGRYPHLIVWIPTFLFQIIGATLIWRANRRVA